IGYKRSQTVYDIINGKAKPSFDFLNKLFMSEYSEQINPMWVITGKGKISSINNNLNEEPATYEKKHTGLEGIFRETQQKLLQITEEVGRLNGENAQLRERLKQYEKIHNTKTRAS